MIKNFLYLSDGTCISSGVDQTNAIQSCTVTECVNSEKELTIGSTCCACLETKILAPGGELNIPAGKAVTLYKEVDGSAPVQAGVFLPERPAKANANVYKLTAYDKVSLLDKDVSAWLKGLKWPAEGYPLLTFAGMVCAACDLKLVTTSIPNATMPVYRFYKAGVTGRQLMRWIGECAGRFCRANAKGEIEFAWYTSSGAMIRATGDRYYFAGKLSYEDYNVAAIDAVKLRLVDSEDGALWPSSAADNPYIITGNPILISGAIADREPYLMVIQQELAKLPAYKPCKVSLPASMEIRAGHTVQIVDRNGAEFTTCVMTKTQKGQQDTLECTGSARRDSASATSNKSAAQLAAEQDAYAQSVAKQAVDGQAWKDLFNKWTDDGKIQGIFAQDGVWMVNAAVAKITNLVADDIQSGTLDAAKVTIQNLKVNAADITGVITVKGSDGNALFTAGEQAVTIAGWNVGKNSIYKKREGDAWGTGTFVCTGSNDAYSIGGSDKISGWAFGAGGKFGVTTSGDAYCSSLHVNDGCTLGAWRILNNCITSATAVEGEGIVNSVWLEPERVVCIYNQGSGDGIIASWEDIVKAANSYASLEARVAALEA